MLPKQVGELSFLPFADELRDVAGQPSGVGFEEPLGHAFGCLKYGRVALQWVWGPDLPPKGVGGGPLGSGCPVGPGQGQSIWTQAD